jgi:hypothetical protein
VCTSFSWVFNQFNAYTCTKKVDRCLCAFFVRRLSSVLSTNKQSSEFVLYMGTVIIS